MSWATNGREFGQSWPQLKSLAAMTPSLNRGVVNEFNSRALISCWHENEGESVAMWKLYVSGREGVAIKTTVGRLERALTAKPEKETPNWACRVHNWARTVHRY